MQSERSRNKTTEPGITLELNLWAHGDTSALNRAFPKIYAELHRLAEIRLNEHRGNGTIDASALLHEAYMKLSKTDAAGFQSRGKFFALASEIMRGILVDYARRSSAAKRGRRVVDVRLSQMSASDASAEVLAVHDSLDKLRSVNPELAAIAEYKYFGGLDIAEICEVMEISEATAKRRWNTARAWLRTHMLV